MAGVLFLATLALYLLTLSPSINFGDSPELIASAQTLGIAHPPGYPLYSLTGKLFTFLPWGDEIARRVNFASAFFTAAGIFFLALILSHWTKSIFGPAGVLPPLFLAASPTLWSQSIIAEVYALNLFFFSLLLYLASCWWKSRDNRFLLAAAFIFGLGLGNHHTLVAFGPLLVFFLFFRKGQTLRDLKNYLLLFMFFALGLMVYLYLPLRSLQSPPLDWGDPESLGRFLDVVLRRQFPTGEGGLTLQRGWTHLTYYLNLVSVEFTLPLALVGLWGLVRGCRAGMAPFLFLMALFLIHGVGTLLFLNPSPDSYGDVSVMMFPSFVVVILWIGWGINDITSILSRRRGGLYGQASFAVLLLAILVYQGSQSFRQNNAQNNYFALDYAANILKSTQENGVIFVEADNSLFPLWYLQYVEGQRPDVAVIDVDFLMLPWFKRQIKERYPAIDIKVEDLGRHASGGSKGGNLSRMLDAYKVAQMEVIVKDLIHKRPLYVSYEFGSVYRRFKELKEVSVIDEGLLYRISKGYSRPDISAWDSYNLRSLMDRSINKDPFTKVLSLAYVRSMQRRAQVLFEEGKRAEAKVVLDRIDGIKREAAALF